MGKILIVILICSALLTRQNLQQLHFYRDYNTIWLKTDYTLACNPLLALKILWKKSEAILTETFDTNFPHELTYCIAIAKSSRLSLV